LLHIVLHQPEIPDNAGNVGRSCVALGAKLWLVRPLGFRLDDRHLRRAGLDYWQHLDWEAVDDWAALLSRLPGDCPNFHGGHGAGVIGENGTVPLAVAGTVPIFVPTKMGLSPLPSVGENGTVPLSAYWFFTKHATKPYTQADFSPGDVLVFGSESQGLPHSLLDGCPDRCLRIPMNTEARSLNLAVSVAVAAYEARRQLVDAQKPTK
jgi:tRNA (cytidine/uridine-2'-O-)-methyltransferase